MPNCLKKEPRTLRPNQILTQWHNLEQSNRQIRQTIVKETQALIIDPEKFFEQFIGFKPYAYQKEFIEMFQNNQFTAARWCRQSGKTFIIAAILLWYATTHPQTAIAIVGPSFRQTKRILQRIATFTHNLPPNIAFKPQRTQIHFANGSTIEAFPNNPDTIRGPSFNVVYCLPAGVKVTLANGNQIPIEQLKSGQKVLSYNLKTGEIEPKHVLRTFRNPRAGRRIIRISHMNGTLDCTAEHKIYTLTRGFVNSSQLSHKDKILYLAFTTKDGVGDKNKIPSFHTVDRNPEAINLRWNVGRPLHPKTRKFKKKCTCGCESFFQTSRLCAIQIFDTKEYSKKAARRNLQFRWLGKVPNKILYADSSRNNPNLSHLLSKRCQDRNSTMVRSNKQSSCTSNMVYGRWQYFKISGKHQHKQIYSKRTVAPTTMAQKSMGLRFSNSRRQPRQRILLTIKRKKSRYSLQPHKTICYTFDAIQDFAPSGDSALLYLRATSPSQQSGVDSEETCRLFEQGMQKQIGQTQPRLEAQRSKALCCLWETVYPHSTKNPSLFKGLLPKLQASIQKNQSIAKQETKKTNTMLTMPETIYSEKRAPKNMQCEMQKNKKNNLSTEVLLQAGSQTASSNQIMECTVLSTNICQYEEYESLVYDIEVEDNHNFFADGVLVSNCDEMNFIANDQELYDAVLYTLGTTDGKFICSSTPWHTDSIFFKIFNHKDFQDFRTSHVTFERAMYPNGPLKPGIIQKIRTQMGDDQARWRREMEAEWVEDDNVWLPQSLIASCIGTTKSCGQELQNLNPEAATRGEFFCGLDLAQTKDFSVFSVVERLNGKLFLRHLKIFQQPTLYAQVLGYIKTLQNRWGGFQKIRVDFTREGPSIIFDMLTAGIDKAEGVNFSLPRKSEMASLLKQRMMNKEFFYPLMSWERPYRGEICTELNVERYSLRKDGQIGYSHPNGTHDDVFWSIVLAVYATVEMAPEPFLTVIPR